MHASADTSLAQVIWTDSSQVICFVLVLCTLSCVCSAARNTDDRLSAEGLVSRPALPLLKDRRESDEHQHIDSLIIVLLHLHAKKPP